MRGTATVETALVIIPLLAIVTMAPFIAARFIRAQVARTEAHRDAFDKATMMLVLPEAFMSNHVNDAMAAQFGELTPQTRRHALFDMPDVPDGPANAFSGTGIDAAPAGQAIDFGLFSLDLYPEGFPDVPVEGWAYKRHRNPFDPTNDPVQMVHLMSYAVVSRSPWTYLGWPLVPTQDMIFEPAMMQAWAGGLAKIDDDIRERMKLAE